MSVEIELLAERLGGRAFSSTMLAAVVLDDPRLAAAVGVQGDDLDGDRVRAWLRSVALPPGYVLAWADKRRSLYRLTGPDVPERPGDASEIEPARVLAAGRAVARTLAAAFPEPVSGSDIRDTLWHARRSPHSDHRGRLLALARALAAAHPLGAAQPHPVLELLACAGHLRKSLDGARRVVWQARRRPAAAGPQEASP